MDTSLWSMAMFSVLIKIWLDDCVCVSQFKVQCTKKEPIAACVSGQIDHVPVVATAATCFANRIFPLKLRFYFALNSHVAIAGLYALILIGIIKSRLSALTPIAFHKAKLFLNLLLKNGDKSFIRCFYGKPFWGIKQWQAAAVNLLVLIFQTSSVHQRLYAVDESKASNVQMKERGDE